MVGTIIVIFIISCVGGFYSSEWDSPGPLFLAAIGIALILIIDFTRNENFHPLWGFNKPKFYLKEHALMKDGTVGRIDGIYYEIEGKLINQDSLK